MTVAARARIEHGVVARLREAPDGRPRREHLPAALRETLVDQRLVVPAGELRLLERWLEDRLFGLGELAPLLRDDRVTEVMVNGTRGVWIERDGRLEETGIHFGDPEEILVLIERLVAPLGRRIDLASPLVDARLADGSRVHAVIPPISLVGPVLTIRRFGQRALSPDDLVRNGTLPPDAMEYLVSAVRERRTVLVSGGTSSGKTTTLNALAFAVGDRERMALMGGIDLPLEAIREQIRRGIEIVVHQERDAGGVRRIVEIAELSPERGDPYTLTRVYP